MHTQHDFKSIRDVLLEYSSDGDVIITIQVSDPDSSLLRLLEYIKENSSTGHSFDVVVDPDDAELKKSFGIDGDGAFNIRTIKSKPYVEK